MAKGKLKKKKKNLSHWLGEDNDKPTFFLSNNQTIVWDDINSSPTSMWNLNSTTLMLAIYHIQKCVLNYQNLKTKLWNFLNPTIPKEKKYMKLHKYHHLFVVINVTDNSIP